jgi:ElaB/YqjD/DUF883 family membrane-anchored ribosome-binding protein
MPPVTPDDLIRDLGVVVDDLRTLTTSVVRDANERVAAARGRVDHWLKTMQDRLHEAEERSIEHTCVLANDADAHLRDHAWETIAAAAELGIALGLIMRARAHRQRNAIHEEAVQR